MIADMFSPIQRFLRDESGTATVEFILVVPVYLSMLIMSIELGILTLRHTLLERGLDIAVRDIRLGTGTAPQHDDIKDLVCEHAIMLLECDSKLRLEMRTADIRAFNSLDQSPDCTDSSEPSLPVREFTPGQQNQLMLLRACLRYTPLFPEEILGSLLTTDANGEAAVIVTSAFVQEPL